MVKTTVLGSGASTRSMVVSTVFTRVLTFGSHVRSMLYLTSAEEKGSPLCHFTPGRSLNVHVVGPVSFHSVARAGCSLPSGWRATRLSKMLNEMRMSLDDVLKCGSNLEMSPPWATTSSRLAVVCACAGAGSSAAAPATPAVLRRSRRVRSLIDTSGKSGAICGQAGAAVKVPRTGGRADEDRRAAHSHERALPPDAGGGGRRRGGGLRRPVDVGS